MKIAVLGSTGSIGTSTLQVAAGMKDAEVFGITANTDTVSFQKQIELFRPEVAVIADREAYREFSGSYKGRTRLICGSEGICELVSMKEVDMVVNGLSGLSGLRPTLAALSGKKKVAIANKEAIVMGWGLIKGLIAEDNQLMPVDSEHSAIFQCLRCENIKEVSRIILTASGGAVYGKSREELEKVTFDDCLSHPTWNMGRKITIDSATLMNKGLEVIEAHNLFGMDYDRISVLIHPQSAIHGIVEFIDGSIIAHMASADMKIPIRYALSHPGRERNDNSRLNLAGLGTLEFSEPDTVRFPCLDIAVGAGRGGAAKVVMLCAADEAAIEGFSRGIIRFTDIPDLIRKVLSKNVPCSADTIEGIESLYGETLKIAGRIMEDNV
ncbi:MAG: 1-deoxy-D-xylulose-5-phosphate reductoisomerase [Elusimicrobia bacterium]|nr:1-deoxy-D-xylulose-5-phosphate reductoisomerase [Elusimicrobiota bacterium]